MKRLYKFGVKPMLFRKNISIIRSGLCLNPIISICYISFLDSSTVGADFL